MGEEKVPRLFGTNGVRGVVNGTIDASFASRMGLAFSLFLRRKDGKARVKVGTDTRVSSEMLKSAVISGLLSGGAEVVDIGVSPSPAIQHAVGSDDSCNGGVIITASHNPPEFNGIKCIAGDGTELGRSEEAYIERVFFSDISGVDWAETGRFFRNGDANGSYISAIISRADVDALKERAFRVIVDCSNGAASLTTPYLLEKLGCSVISLNCHPDGLFPGHMSEPTEVNLRDTADVVASTGADIGAVHDGDADRAVFIDEKGNYISGNVSLAIFAKYEVLEAIKSGNPHPKVVTAVDSSSAVGDVVRKAGGEVIYTKIGSPVVARVMMREGAVFGGEGNGGAILSEFQYCRDGAMSIVRMLEIMAKTGKKLSELAAEIPVYYQGKASVDYFALINGGGVERMSEIKELFMKELEKSISDSIPLSFTVKERDNTDGIKLYVESPAGEGCSSWVMIRPSGTEPIIRVTSEACTGEAAEKLAVETGEFVASVMEGVKK